MPTKEDLLEKLTIKELRQLAKQNRVSLTKEGMFWDSTASTKEDIIEILVESPKITKDKILALSKPIENTARVVQIERKIEEKHIEEKITPERKVQAPTVGKTTMKELVETIKSVQFIGERKERGYEGQLYQALCSRGYPVEHEGARRGARFDLIVGKDEVAVELKIVNSAGIFDSLFGQIHRYKDQFKNIIVVLIDELRNPSLLEREKKRIKDLNPENIEIVVK